MTPPVSSAARHPDPLAGSEGIWTPPDPVLVYRRARARREQARRRKHAARVGLVGVFMLMMLGPSLRAPVPFAESSSPAVSQPAAPASPPAASPVPPAVPPSPADVAPQGGFDNPVAGAGAALPQAATPAVAAEPLGWLRIPRIGLDAAFFAGVHADVIARGPGLWPGTPLPGGLGNAVLSGHRTTNTAPFGDLDLLVPGDQVVVSAGRSETLFVVTGTQIVDQASYVDAVLAPPAVPGDRILTMFACHPKGAADQRIIVRARAVGAPPG